LLRLLSKEEGGAAYRIDTRRGPEGVFKSSYTLESAGERKSAGVKDFYLEIEKKDLPGV
jgi:hypothetical protein